MKDYQYTICRLKNYSQNPSLLSHGNLSVPLLQSDTTAKTCNTSLVMFNIKKCCNICSDTTALLISQYAVKGETYNSIAFCLIHLLLIVSTYLEQKQNFALINVLVSFRYLDNKNFYLIF